MNHYAQTHYKSYPCPVAKCGFIARSKQLLKMHSLKHSKVRPFQCETCKLRYKTKHALFIHQQGVHQGLKPWHCTWPDCDYRHSRQSEVVSHVKRSHLKYDQDRRDPKQFVVEKDDEEECEDGQPKNTKAKSKNQKCDTLGLYCWVDGCEQYFKDKVELGVHLEEFHKIGRIRCMIRKCSASFQKR